MSNIERGPDDYPPHIPEKPDPVADAQDYHEEQSFIEKVHEIVKERLGENDD